jgi:predicted nuclease of predicted toxin-antitoxin system
VKFLVDQDIPDDIFHLLRHLGHEVTLLRDVLPITASDTEIIAYAYQHSLVIVTCNRDDFLALAAHPKDDSGLIILIRRRSRHAECNHLSKLLNSAGEMGIKGNINFA